MNDGYRNLPAINQGGVFGTPVHDPAGGRRRRVPDPLGRRSRVRTQRRRDRQHRDQVGHQRPARSAFEYFRNDGLGRAQLLQHRAATRRTSSATTSSAPRSAGRSSRTGPSSSWPTKASARTAASRAPPRSRPQRSSRDAIAANGGAVNPVIAGLLAQQPVAGAEPGAGRRGNNLQATTPFSNDARQPDRQDRPPLREERPAHRALLLRQQRPELPLRPGIGRSAARLQHRHADDGAPRSRPRSRTCCRRSCCVELRGGYNRFHENFFPEDSGFDPNSIGLNTVERPAELRAARRSACRRFATLGANISLPRGRVDTN